MGNDFSSKIFLKLLTDGAGSFIQAERLYR